MSDTSNPPQLGGLKVSKQYLTIAQTNGNLLVIKATCPTKEEALAIAKTFYDGFVIEAEWPEGGEGE